MAETYNGWKNRATWNVALWVNNDESLYNMAVAYAKRKHKEGKRVTWSGFVKHYGMEDEKTPDGFKYLGQSLDYKTLNEMMQEFIN